MMKQLLFLFFCFWSWAVPIKAQTFTEIASLYPVTRDGSKCVVTGFVPFKASTDEKIYTNALLWAIDNICPQLREGITNVDIEKKSFECDLVLASAANKNNLYYGKASFRVADGKLIYYLSDILVESSVLVMKKVTPLEKLNPEKKASHRQTLDDFVQTESVVLNSLFDFITVNKPAPITHWSDISIRRPVEGMNEDECRLAFGKPKSVLESNGEVQWMYGSSFYLFFKNGRVKTIIK